MGEPSQGGVQGLRDALVRLIRSSRGNGKILFHALYSGNKDSQARPELLKDSGLKEEPVGNGRACEAEAHRGGNRHALASRRRVSRPRWCRARPTPKPLLPKLREDPLTEVKSLLHIGNPGL
jgi:hypothetical protein